MAPSITVDLECLPRLLLERRFICFASIQTKTNSSGFCLGMLPNITVLEFLPWSKIWHLAAASRSWRETALQWHSNPHSARCLKFNVSGNVCSFICNLSCNSMIARQHHDVILSFGGLSARKDPRFRWVWQVGDEHFDDRDEDWWNDDEYPYAAGLYICGYTNQPDFFKKMNLPPEVEGPGSHKVELIFDLDEDGYSDEDIELVVDGHVMDTGPGLGMKGRGKGSIKVGPIVPSSRRQLEVRIFPLGPVCIWNEEARSEERSTWHYWDDGHEDFDW